jgi:glycosyltransferase involved in cell wall biosynthesis
MADLTLSLLLANYNHAEYVGGALAQLVGQTQPPLEVVVVDDGSTDDSLAVIDAVAAREPLVRVVRSPRNQGVCAAYNLALREARGDFVWLFACDDHAEPDLVAEVGRLLARHPEAGVVCWDPAGLDPATGQVLPEPRGWSATPVYLDPPQTALALARKGKLGGTSVVFRRDELLAVGGFRPELRWYSDWFAATVIALRRGLVYRPGVLAAFRVRAGSYSQRGHRDWAALRVVVPALLDLLDSPGLADVREAFRATGELRMIGWRGLCLALTRRRSWPWITRRMARGVAIDGVLHLKAALFPWLPAPLLAAYRRLTRLWRRPPKPMVG